MKTKLKPQIDPAIFEELKERFGHLPIWRVRTYIDFCSNEWLSDPETYEKALERMKEESDHSIICIDALYNGIEFQDQRK